MGLAAIFAAVGFFIWHYESITSEAAQVPALNARIAQDDATATALSQRLADVTKARDAADAALTAWQANSAQIIATVKKEGAHAAASINPVCAPSDADRSVRNDALVHLLGAQQPASAVGVPNTSSPSH